MSLLDAWRRWRQARALQRRAIPDELWVDTLRAYPFLARRPLQDLQDLRAMASLFLDHKEFSAAGGLELEDAMAVAVAAQACLPVLKLGLHHYDGFVGIVLHPDEVRVARHWVDEDGIVHEGEEVLAGEAMAGGPVMLSWHDVTLAGDAQQPYNVVVHEFVHVLDLLDGEADGVPPLPDRAWRERWCRVMNSAWERLCEAVERDEAVFLDPYATQGIDEFFPVAAEAFFVAPRGLRTANPEVYALLRDYFGQDTATHGLA
jgi:Mlc titration factor MtfA (ptsG expression regulator)